MKLNKKWRADIEHQVRFNDKFKSYDYTFTELGLSFSPIKRFRFNANYRNMHYDRGLRHRYALEAHVNFQPEGSKFYFHIRERFQSFVWNDDNSSVSNIRNLGTIGYKVKKWAKVYTTQEWFFRLDNFNQIKTYRGTLGINWNFTDKLMLMTYYSFQRTLNSEAVRKIHIIGLRGFYKLDFSKKQDSSK